MSVTITKITFTHTEGTLATVRFEASGTEHLADGVDGVCHVANQRYELNWLLNSGAGWAEYSYSYTAAEAGVTGFTGGIWNGDDWDIYVTDRPFDEIDGVPQGGGGGPAAISICAFEDIP